MQHMNTIGHQRRLFYCGYSIRSTCILLWL